MVEYGRPASMRSHRGADFASIEIQLIRGGNGTCPSLRALHHVSTCRDVQVDSPLSDAPHTDCGFNFTRICNVNVADKAVSSSQRRLIDFLCFQASHGPSSRLRRRDSQSGCARKTLSSPRRGARSWWPRDDMMHVPMERRDPSANPWTHLLTVAPLH